MRSGTRRMVTALGAILGLMAVAAEADALPFRPRRIDRLSPTQTPTAAQNALLDEAIGREKAVIATLRERAPVVETYLQRMRPDRIAEQVPASDERFLGRVDFRKVIWDTRFQTDRQSPYDNTGGKLHTLGRPFGSFHNPFTLQFSDVGFVQMLLMDSNSFDREHYRFGYVRSEFLGSVPTQVYDVMPIPQRQGLSAVGVTALGMKTTTGRFFGRIWVETRSGSVVRFNGDFAGSEKNIREYYHFDSWRTNVDRDLWLPTSIYLEESDARSATRTLKFKAVSRIWGYSLKLPAADSENTSMEVVGATDTTEDASDVSPLGAQREWAQESEDNVVERLFTAGMLAAPSAFDKTMESLVNNILVYNHRSVPKPIRVRTLLTDSLESMAVGNTIIVSKALLDTSAVISESGDQQAGNLNAVLAFQLSHILLGHRLDTRYAFNDTLLFKQTQVARRLPMHHTDGDNADAAKMAEELLSAPELTSGQQYFGLYLRELRQREQSLTALSEPLIGDGLERSRKDHTFWLESLIAKAPKLDEADLGQRAAAPLSSFLRVDPQTDEVILLKTGEPTPLLTAADKMPFEISPVVLRLRYREPAVPATPDRSPAPHDTPASPSTP